MKPYRIIIEGEGRERTMLGLVWQDAYWRLRGYEILGGTLPEVEKPYLIAEKIPAISGRDENL